MIAIIDTGTCNLTSLCRALERVGAPFRVIESGRHLKQFESAIIPGVSSFASTISAIEARGFRDPIMECKAKNVPLLGICVGLQILAESSDEGEQTDGLGLVKGRVQLLPKNQGLPVPNQGWRRVQIESRGSQLINNSIEPVFYFSHSYFLESTSLTSASSTLQFGAASILATFEEFPIFGTQFHPEKSQDAGLEFLRSFAKLTSPARGHRQ